MDDITVYREHIVELLYKTDNINAIIFIYRYLDRVFHYKAN